MAWHEIAWNWLVQTTLGNFLILGAGSLAMTICRQPVRRLRVIALTVTGCAIVPFLGQVPGMPRLSVGWPQPEDFALATAPRAVESLSVPPITNMRTMDSRPPWSPDRREVLPRGRRVTALICSVPMRLMIVSAYTLAAAGLFAWWLVGQLTLLRLCRTAFPASTELVHPFRELASPADQRVRLLQSERIGLPFTFTWCRPVIVLPVDFEKRNNAVTVRCCLAHEWSHIERRDAWTWNITFLVGLITFYQPLFWWLRRQLRLCQDYLADARAIEHASAAEDYAEYLLNLARHRINGRALPALGIGDRRSNLYRRIEMLVQAREPLARRCGSPWNVGTISTSVVLIVFASSLRLDAKVREPDSTGSTFSAAQLPAARPSTPGTAFVGRVRDKDTGKPVALAKVYARFSVTDRTTHNRKTLTEIRQRTSTEGIYRFTITPEQLTDPTLLVHLDVEHPGYLRWRHSHNVLAEHRDRRRFSTTRSSNQARRSRRAYSHPRVNPQPALRLVRTAPASRCLRTTTSSGRSRKP